MYSGKKRKKNIYIYLKTGQVDPGCTYLGRASCSGKNEMHNHESGRPPSARVSRPSSIGERAVALSSCPLALSDENSQAAARSPVRGVERGDVSCWVTRTVLWNKHVGAKHILLHCTKGGLHFRE